MAVAEVASKVMQQKRGHPVEPVGISQPSPAFTSTCLIWSRRQRGNGSVPRKGKASRRRVTCQLRRWRCRHGTTTATQMHHRVPPSRARVRSSFEGARVTSSSPPPTAATSRATSRTERRDAWSQVSPDTVPILEFSPAPEFPPPLPRPSATPPIHSPSLAIVRRPRST